MTRRNQAVTRFLLPVAVWGAAICFVWIFGAGSARSQSAVANRFDVLGVKIGMSLAQAREILRTSSGKSFSDGLEVKDTHGGKYFPGYSKGSPFAYDYVWNYHDLVKPDENITLALQGPSDHESVIAIHRSTFHFRPNPDLASTLDKMKEKYGKTTAFQTGQMLVWVYSPSGELQSSIAPQSGNYDCAVATPPLRFGVLGGMAKTPVQINSIIVDEVPDSLKKEFGSCDFVVRAQFEVGLLAGSSAKVVRSIDIDVFDGRFFLKGLLARQDWAKAALDAEHKNAAQKSKDATNGVKF
jgi:hypothetical protein